MGPRLSTTHHLSRPACLAWVMGLALVIWSGMSLFHTSSASSASSTATVCVTKTKVVKATNAKKKCSKGEKRVILSSHSPSSPELCVQSRTKTISALTSLNCPTGRVPARTLTSKPFVSTCVNAKTRSIQIRTTAKCSRGLLVRTLPLRKIDPATTTTTSPVNASSPTAGTTTSSTSTTAAPTTTTTTTSTTIAPTTTTTASTSSTSTTAAPTTTTTTTTTVPFASISSFTASHTTINRGESTTLSATYVGATANINQSVGAVLSGSTTAVSPTTTTTYTLTVSNGVDHTVTRNLTISVNSLTLSAQPQDIITSNPSGENFTVTATASGARSYQWFKNSNAITGANSSSYRATQDGTYHVVVTSTLNGVTRSETSTTATFAMNTVSIATQPTAALVADGSTNTFSIAATGSGTLTYQWIRNSSQISGATSDTFTSGVYGNHEVVVTSTLNGHTTSVTSNSVLLDVNTVTITSGPTDSYMTQGGTKSLGVSVSSHGSATISYQWYFNDAAIAGENDIGIYANQAGEYKVKVTSVRGGTTFSRFSSTATVTEVPPPAISSFTSASSNIGLGNSTQITAIFSGGTGVITPGDIPVSSGDTITVTPTVSTSYTLSVQNPAGTQSGQTIRISVMTGTFAAVSNVSSVDRYSGARAITLPSGKVVVFGNDAYTNITDVYNPTTNSFSRVGDMARGRHRFATALLNDGKVLAIGGMYLNGATYTSLATVEIFDPITETWSYTGSLNVAREGAIAVVLPNGKVLVTGGMMRAPGTTYLSSAEIYDPATGLFTYVNSMPQARGSATGALMADGRVFIAGGYNGTNGHMKSAVIYNPSLNTWTTVTSQMNSIHSEGGAVTLLMNDGRMIVAGGWNPSDGVWTIDVYNPVTNSFVAAANLPQFSHGRGGITGHVLSNGLVAFIGGSSGASGDIANTIVLYDPVTNTMATEANTMSARRYRQASALMNDGRIIIIGGNFSLKTAAEVYTQ